MHSVSREEAPHIRWSGGHIVGGPNGDDSSVHSGLEAFKRVSRSARDSVEMPVTPRCRGSIFSFSTVHVWRGRGMARVVERWGYSGAKRGNLTPASSAAANRHHLPLERATGNTVVALFSFQFDSGARKRPEKVVR